MSEKSIHLDPEDDTYKVYGEEDDDDFNLFRAISAELQNVPIQTEPLNRESVVPELEPRGSVNVLPEIEPTARSSQKGSFIEEDGIKRSGTTLTASAHIITAVIGAGVLSLPYSMASLGWIAGPICFLLFASITLYTAQLLADLYIIDGKRQRTYTMMVETVFGRPGKIAIGIVQQFNLVLTTLAYTITAAQSMQMLADSACGTEKVDAGDCFNTYWVMAVIFGALQIVLSQTPNLEHFWWASIIGAVMSFGYALIALVLCFVYFDNKGSIGGMDVGSSAATAWNILNAIGAVLFAYSFSFILLEIQDTMRSDKRKGKASHGPIKPMKNAVNVCVAIMTIFYMLIAVFGYLSQGNNVQSFILSSFKDAGAPDWVLNWAISMILIHMIPAYQVWSQPHFEFVEMQAESWKKWRPRGLTKLAFRLSYRTIYVCFMTFFACLLPFFGVILGFVGAVGFWPATVFFPVECWIKVFKPSRKLKYFLRVLDVFCFIVTVACIAGSVEEIISSASTMVIFGS